MRTNRYLAASLIALTLGLAFMVGLYVGAVQLPSHADGKPYSARPSGTISYSTPKKCQEDTPSDQSELCAQWKSADASAQAVKWAATGTLASIVNGLLVFVAIYVAFQSNRIASDTAKRDSRAYIKVSPTEKHQTTINIGALLVISLRAENYGRTPALNTNFQYSLGHVVSDWQWSDEHIAKRSPDIRSIIHPGADTMCDVISTFVVTESMMQSVSSGTHMFVARAVYFYDDVFGVEHITQANFKIATEDIARGSLSVGGEGNLAT